MQPLITLWKVEPARTPRPYNQTIIITSRLALGDPFPLNLLLPWMLGYMSTGPPTYTGAAQQLKI